MLLWDGFYCFVACLEAAACRHGDVCTCDVDVLCPRVHAPLTCPPTPSPPHLARSSTASMCYFNLQMPLSWHLGLPFLCCADTASSGSCRQRCAHCAPLCCVPACGRARAAGTPTCASAVHAGPLHDPSSIAAHSVAAAARARAHSSRRCTLKHSGTGRSPRRQSMAWQPSVDRLLTKSCSTGAQWPKLCAEPRVS